MPESFRQKSSGALIFRPTIAEQEHINQMNVLAKDKEELTKSLKEVAELKEQLTNELAELRKLKNEVNPEN